MQHNILYILIISQFLIIIVLGFADYKSMHHQPKLPFAGPVLKNLSNKITSIFNADVSEFLPRRQIKRLSWAVLNDHEDKDRLQNYLKLFGILNNITITEIDENRIFRKFERYIAPQNPINKIEIGKKLLSAAIRNNYLPLAELSLTLLKDTNDYAFYVANANAVWGNAKNAKKKLLNLLDQQKESLQELHDEKLRLDKSGNELDPKKQKGLKQIKIRIADLHFFIAGYMQRRGYDSGVRAHLKKALPGNYGLDACLSLFRYIAPKEFSHKDLQALYEKSDKIKGLINADELEIFFNFLKNNGVKKYKITVNAAINTNSININVYDKRVIAIEMRGIPVKKFDILEELDDLQYLAIEKANLFHIPILNTNLKILSLRSNSIKKIKNLDALKLKALDLAGNHISTISGLEQQDQLQHLNLKYNQIIRIENLTNLKRLNSLVLNNNDISRLDGLKHLGKTLQRLDLVNNKIRKIEGLENLLALQRLNLENNQIVELEGLDSLTALKWLYLKKNKIIRIKRLNSLTALEEFSIGSDRLDRLEGMDHLKNLKQLTFYGQTIENLNGLEELEELILESNHPDNIKGLEKLGRLQNLTKLELNIKGKKKLLIPSIPALRSLKINDCGNSGNVRAIIQIGNNKLEELYIQNHDLRSWPNLSGLKQLKALHLEQLPRLGPVESESLPAGIKSLTLRNINLKTLNGIKHLSKLKEVDLGVNPRISTLAPLQTMYRLKTLNIEFCKGLLNKNLIKGLDGIRTLKTLKIDDSQYHPENNKLNQANIFIKIKTR